MGTVFSCNLMHLIGKCSSQKVTLNEMINLQHLFAEKEKCKHLDDYRVWNQKMFMLSVSLAVMV